MGKTEVRGAESEADAEGTGNLGMTVSASACSGTTMDPCKVSGGRQGVQILNIGIGTVDSW